MKRQSKEVTTTENKAEPIKVSAEPKMVQKKVTKREEYVVSEPEHVTEPMRPVTPVRPIALHPFPQDSGDEDQPEDQLYEFLDRLDREMGYSIKIERLPQFNVTGKFGRGATTVYCGEMPVSIGELTADAHLSHIQNLYGPGAYRITLRDQASRILKVWPVVIDAPLSQTRPAPNLGGQLARHQPEDTLEDLAKKVETINRINKALGLNREPVQQAIEVPHRTVEEKTSVEERMAEKVLDAVLARKADNPDLMEKFLRKYVGQDEQRDDWASLVKELLVPILPVLLQAGMKFLAPPIAPVEAAITAEGNGVSSAIHNPASAAQSGNISQPQQQATPMQLGWLKLLSRIRQGILDNESVDVSVNTFDWFLERFPEGQVQAATLVNAEPASILQGIQVEVGSTSLEWLMEFQQAAKNIDAEETAEEVAQ
jgi:hypothetical protein